MTFYGSFHLIRHAGFCLKNAVKTLLKAHVLALLEQEENNSALALKEEQKEKSFGKNCERSDHVSESVQTSQLASIVPSERADDHFSNFPD